jgi:hypothetical protein
VENFEMKAKILPIASRLALIAASTILALALAEGMLRVLPNLEQAPVKYREVIGDALHQWDPLLGWRTVPNAVATLQSAEYKVSVHNNSRGIRGPEYPYIPERNEYRILVIGDSFAAGYTVPFEKTFGQIVQRNLNALSEKQHTVIAAGVEAYSTDQELLFFLEEGWRYQPDLTVLMFFFNDVWYNAQLFGGADFGSKPLFRFEGEELVLAHMPVSMSRDAATRRVSLTPRERPMADASITLTIKQWLSAHSRLYRLVRLAVKNGFSRTRIPLRSMWFSDRLVDSARVFQTEYDEDIRRAWVMTEAIIKRFAQEVARRGGRFVLFHIPERASVYDDEWNKAKVYHGWKDAEWRADQVEVELRRICAAHSLDCVLPTSQFREQAAKIAPRRLYLVNDFHWSGEGHELAAKLSIDHIERRVPQPTKGVVLNFHPNN